MSVLEVINAELTVKGPLFIASGATIEKKEYAFLVGENKVGIMNQAKLAVLLDEKGLIDEYTKFCLGSNTDDLAKWLGKKEIGSSDYKSCIRYYLDAGDDIDEDKSKLEISEFIKDAYGMPYIPGSSIKGCLRTILMNYFIETNPKDYYRYYDDVMKITRSSQSGENRDNLKEINDSLEKDTFRKLGREGKNINTKDAVNDIMSAVIVSDSEPIDVNSLVLCKKIDMSPQHGRQPINTLRECIKPETKIRFRITIDKSLFAKCGNLISKEVLEDAIKRFSNQYYDNFLSKFNGLCDRPEDNSIWLGGGAGFVSKTVVYPLLGEDDGRETAIEIFKKVGFKKNHTEETDRLISPHMCKMTNYQGGQLQFGLCELKLTTAN